MVINSVAPCAKSLKKSVPAEPKINPSKALESLFKSPSKVSPTTAAICLALPAAFSSEVAKSFVFSSLLASVIATAAPLLPNKSKAVAAGSKLFLIFSNASEVVKPAF